MTNKGLKYWVAKLKTQNTPVLGDVIIQLNAITGDDQANFNQMSELILRDANLTSHVLRVANSVQYNYGKTHINTVSRAIVLIGLKGMRAVCISLLIIDTLLVGQSKERILQLMAQGFHAGTQARNLLSKSDDEAESAEEAFIAGLLFNLGEMAFWSLEPANGDTEALLSSDVRVKKRAMDSLLGTSFKAMTKSLAVTWQLGDTLIEALNNPECPSEKAKAVILGERISRAALYGWDSLQLKKVLGEVTTFTHVSQDDALALIKKGADQAAEVALDFGVNEACPLIPNSFRKGPLVSGSRGKIMKGDPALQLNILRDLTAATNDRLDVNTVFQMAVEGMHRGIGLERVSFSLINKRKLEAKYMLGEGTQHWRKEFTFDVGPYAVNPFTHTLEQNEPCWFNPEIIAANKDLYSKDVINLLGKKPCFISILVIESRPVAMFYADRGHFGGSLTKDQFESFKHFSHQTQISLHLLSSAPNKYS